MGQRDTGADGAASRRDADGRDPVPVQRRTSRDRGGGVGCRPWCPVLVGRGGDTVGALVRVAAIAWMAFNLPLSVCGEFWPPWPREVVLEPCRQTRLLAYPAHALLAGTAGPAGVATPSALTGRGSRLALAPVVAAADARVGVAPRADRGSGPARSSRPARLPRGAGDAELPARAAHRIDGARGARVLGGAAAVARLGRALRRQVWRRG
jgi:hypothetical protein